MTIREKNAMNVWEITIKGDSATRYSFILKFTQGTPAYQYTTDAI